MPKRTQEELENLIRDYEANRTEEITLSTKYSDPSPQRDREVKLNYERAKRLERGSSFYITGKADPVPLQGRSFDQTVYLALLIRAQGYKAAGITTPIINLRDRDDVNHVLTPDEVIELVSQSMQWFESVMATSWAMKDGLVPFENGIPDDYTNDIYWPT